MTLPSELRPGDPRLVIGLHVNALRNVIATYPERGWKPVLLLVDEQLVAHAERGDKLPLRATWDADGSLVLTVTR